MGTENLLGQVNYLAVLVAALAAFILGALWYGPFFGKRWMAYMGLSGEDLKEGTMPMPAVLGVNYVATALSAFAIALFLGPESDAAFGIFAGIMIALFWIGTSRLNDVLYESRPWGLFFINVGYYLVTYTVMGAILGAWH